jgi:adenine/guanine/hypoxanthine permease
VISYTAIRIARGGAREIGAFMWVLTVVFLVHYALHPVEGWLGVH